MQVGKLQSGQPGTAFIMLGRGLIRVAHAAGKKEPKGSREHYQRHQLRRTRAGYWCLARTETNNEDNRNHRKGSSNTTGCGLVPSTSLKTKYHAKLTHRQQESHGGGSVTCQLHVQCSATSGQSLAEVSPVHRSHRSTGSQAHTLQAPPWPTWASPPGLC